MPRKLNEKQNAEMPGPCPRELPENELAQGR
jgi:hypothetical protein